ncbi:MAG: glycoside hydrolase family 3 protein [Cytophagales bacterium]|nr:glycoside hydrolase family 3 protein [Cytophaga sp.]
MKYSYICYIVLIVFSACKTKTSHKSKTPVVKHTEQTTTKPKDLLPALRAEDSLDLKIGQMIMIGINMRTSLSATDTLIKELSSNKTGGIILFEKNIAQTNSSATLKTLIGDLQSKATVPLFISIDEEGGKVHRLKEKYGFVKMPSAGYLGNINNTDTTLFYNRALAAQLSGLGINLNYAPDVDLALNKDNPIIAKVGRSFSADPAIVTTQAAACIQAHHEYGVKTIIKHFPGHGSSMTDSHLGITDVTNQWNIIELLPYKNLIRSGTVDAIMTAHVINAHLDSTRLPSTLSKVVVTDVLRNILEFKGVVFSDDMQMYAISKNYGLENAIKLSILAGVDVLVFGNNVNINDRIKASEIHAIIKNLVKTGQIPMSRIDESFQRIMELKKKSF